jgi:hypothetical protein
MKIARQSCYHYSEVILSISYDPHFMGNFAPIISSWRVFRRDSSCRFRPVRLDSYRAWVVQHTSLREAVHELKTQTAILVENLELLRSRTS